MTTSYENRNLWTDTKWINDDRKFWRIWIEMLPIMKILIVAMTVLVLGKHRLAHVEHSTKESAEIGLKPKLGEAIPLDSTFNDERGNPVRLGHLIQTPTILALVYYHCPNVCSFLLQNMAEVLNKLPAEPGKDYTVLSVSFDETESPQFALEKKRFYLKMIERPFPEDAWRFLTGDKENIQKLTQAVGFQFQRVDKDFSIRWLSSSYLMRGRSSATCTVRIFFPLI